MGTYTGENIIFAIDGKQIKELKSNTNTVVDESLVEIHTCAKTAESERILIVLPVY